AVEQVGLHQNFFELGGHSLLLMRVLVELQTEVSPELTIIDLFQYPTVSALARHLDRLTQPQKPSVLRNVRADPQDRVQKQRRSTQRRIEAASRKQREVPQTEV